MSSKTVPDLAAFFSPTTSGEYSVWSGPQGGGDRFGGFYIGENVVLTAAHCLYDIRYTVDTHEIRHWTLVQSDIAGPYKHGSVSASWAYSVEPNFISFASAHFATDTNPYTDPAIANYDLAFMTPTSSVAARDLIGAGVFFGASGANQAAIGSTITLEYRLEGTYGTLSGSLTGLSGTSANSSFNALPGMSGGGWVSAFRAVDPNHTYVIGVQSAESDGAALGALLTPTTFYQIMNTLAVGKTGSQATQPTNYLHGSDNGEAIGGTFRPDVIYGNGGNDTIDDGEVNNPYWANDRLAGGSGDDTLSAGRGNDLLHGGEWLSATGATTDLTKDGNDTVTYDEQFASRNGIEITIDDVNQDTTYSSIAGFNTAIFVKDQVSGDIDTLISIETIKGSEGSDAVHFLTLSTARISGVGGNGLNDLDFGSTKAAGEIDTLDLSSLGTPILLNLNESQASGVQDWFALDSPNPTDPTITINGDFLGEHDGNGASISVSGFNYIIGTNVYGALDPHCDDVIIGSPNPETFEQTSGYDKIYCGNGDVLVNKDLESMSYNDYIDVGSIGGLTPGSKTIVHFNGVEIDAVFGWPFTYSSDPDPTGVHEVGTLADIPFGSNLDPYSRTSITLYYDASTMTATLTDTRDGSTMTLDNWVPFYTSTGSYSETFDEYAALFSGGSSSYAQKPRPIAQAAQPDDGVNLADALSVRDLLSFGNLGSPEGSRAISQEAISITFAGLVASAGLASVPIHAEPHDRGESREDGPFLLHRPLTTGQLIDPVSESHALSNEGALPWLHDCISLNIQADREASHSPALSAPDAHPSLSLGINSEGWATELHEASSPVTELHEASSPQGSPVIVSESAARVSPVTAEILQLAMTGVQHAAERKSASVDATQHRAALGHVLADALVPAASDNPDIDSLLHGLAKEGHDQVLPHGFAVGTAATHEGLRFAHIEHDSLMAMHEMIIMHQLAGPHV